MRHSAASGIGTFEPGAWSLRREPLTKGLGPVTVVEMIVVASLAYAAIGVAVAIAFVTLGVSAVDPAARGAGVGFRAIIMPGLAALWPWALVRWSRSPEPRPEGGH